MSSHTNPIDDSRPEPGPAVAVGMHVAIEITDAAGAGERLEFDLVPDKQSDFSAGLMSDRAPLAQAILGRAAGSSVDYQPPSGTPQTVAILKVEPSQRPAAQNNSDRADKLGEAADKIARRESKQIALTTELHYGSIDPDGIKD